MCASAGMPLMGLLNSLRLRVSNQPAHLPQPFCSSGGKHPLLRNTESILVKAFNVAGAYSGITTVRQIVAPNTAKPKLAT